MTEELKALYRRSHDLLLHMDVRELDDPDFAAISKEFDEVEIQIERLEAKRLENVSPCNF